MTMTKQTNEDPSAGAVSIENELLRVVFDLEAGCYRAVDLNTGEVLLRDAGARLGAWDIANAGQVVRRTAETVAVEDQLGRGRTLRVTVEIADENRRWRTELQPRAGRVDVELSLTLYDGLGFLVMGMGVRNRTGRAILLKEFSPLASAVLWPGDGERRDPLTLAGHGALGEAKERRNDNDLTGHAEHGRDGNAVIPGLARRSENNLLLTYRCGTVRRNAVVGGLTYREFLKRAEVREVAGGVRAFLEAYDPVGRLIDADASYRSADLFYLDLLGDDPFVALEGYARNAAAAQGAAPNLYDFPTVCMWYVMVTSGDRRKHTVAAVEQIEHAAAAGFLKYAPVAIRLVPDTYYFEAGGNTEQGWWDDEHWRKTGFYAAPYDTSKAFCQAIRQRGGLPLTYVQTGMPSDDFARAHPDWMLNNSINYLALAHDHEKPWVRFDYSDAGLQEHLGKVWGKLGAAGFAGVMFDYSETGFCGEGGLEDPSSTATAAYRKIFELARAGLGPRAHLDERNMGEVSTHTSLPHQRIPFSDMTLGLVDSQRIEEDSSSFTAAQVARAALRWYKARVFFVYDMDSKSLLFRKIHTRETEDVGDPVMRRRSILTMLYVTAGRILLADSFQDYSPEVIRDLSRLYPMHPARRTARPVDLLLASGRECPRVYSFQVMPGWRQVTLFNPDMKTTAAVSAPLAGDMAAAGALGLAPGAEYYVYDFWNDRLVGRLRGTETLVQELAPGEARMLSVRKVTAHPQVLSSDRHIMQGMVELSNLAWDAETKRLSGTAELVGGEPMNIVLANNGFKPVRVTADRAAAAMGDKAENGDFSILSLSCSDQGGCHWCVEYA